MKIDLDLYIEERNISSTEKNNFKFDILAWWKVDVSKYPILTKMARVVLSILVSNVASELAFSIRGRVVYAYRSRLTSEMVEILICTQDLLKAQRGINYYF